MAHFELDRPRLASEPQRLGVRAGHNVVPSESRACPLSSLVSSALGVTTPTCLPTNRAFTIVSSLVVGPRIETPLLGTKDST
ncbi:hypothetical protein CHELA17_50194 [Chelatococcus asaccharovorans]|nr:hypothetical protein CHELA17_50194 [Chelatococcus asaccharovorans]